MSAPPNPAATGIVIVIASHQAVGQSGRESAACLPAGTPKSPRAKRGGGPTRNLRRILSARL